MWNAIVDVMTNMFEALHNLIIALGVPENAEGVSYVLAIILFTAIIRLLILPLNIKSTKSNAKMQEIQPEMKKLQAKYANDPQKLQLETSKLMKENNVSMTGGCLPALLPLPILMALYGVFYSINPTGSFLWISNIGAPDPFFILPILAALTTYLPSYLMTKSAPAAEGGMNMGTMNIVMSLMMGFMALRFQSLLVIYWVLGGVIQLITTYFINYRPAMEKKRAVEAVEAEKEASRTPKFVMPDYEDSNKASKKKKNKKKKK